MTELDRVNQASPAARQWVQKREQDDDWRWNTDIDAPAYCFFCGRQIRHLYANAPGPLPQIGWGFVVPAADGQFANALYCMSEPCTGPLTSEASQNAKQHLLWRESEGGLSYIEVVGEMGPCGLTPATTAYSE